MSLEVQELLVCCVTEVLLSDAALYGSISFLSASPLGFHYVFSGPGAVTFKCFFILIFITGVNLYMRHCLQRVTWYGNLRPALSVYHSSLGYVVPLPDVFAKARLPGECFLAEGTLVWLFTRVFYCMTSQTTFQGESSWA